jgi:hypothetical protein
MVLYRFFEPSENLAGGEEYRQSLPPIIVFVIILNNTRKETKAKAK